MKNKQEIEVENRDVYIKLEPDESIELKKALLEIEASEINMQIIAEKLKEKTRNELRERALAKRNLRDASNTIYEMIQTLPKTKEMPLIIKRQIAEVSEEPAKMPEEKRISKKELGYEKELSELKKKIASLG